MGRIRLVTTPMWSQDHVLLALGQIGFPDAEAHEVPVGLESWRGLDLGVQANVVIRRDRLGPASDDLGFVRNSQGTFDAVIPEIHFFRCDRRWLEDLARRHDELAVADGLTITAQRPTWEKRELGGVLAPPPPPHPAAARPTRTEAARSTEAAAPHNATRARAQAAEALDELRKRKKRSDGPGCLFSLIAPMLLWTFLALSSPEIRTVQGFFLVVAPLWFALGILRAVRFGRQVKRAAAQLRESLPSGTQARDTAIGYLESKVKPAGSKVEDTVVKDLLRALREPNT